MKAGYVSSRYLLAVLTSPEDAAQLREILSTHDWNLVIARTLHQALEALRANVSVSVVVCDANLADGRGWIDLLTEIQALEVPPQLIVADRFADDRLWVEVLNLGGYDLLVTPFVATEVLHVAGMAWESRSREAELSQGTRYFTRRGKPGSGFPPPHGAAALVGIVSVPASTPVLPKT